MPGVYFVVGLLASILILSQCFQRKEWDLIYILKTEKNIQLTEDFSLNLTSSSTNYSRFVLSAKHIFMSNNLPKPFVVYVKLRIKEIIQTSTVLFSIRDPDHKIRMQMSFKINPGFIKKKELNIIFNPISAEGQVTNLNFTLPYTHTDIWTFGLLFDRNQISLYTTCDDIKRPSGFQTEKILNEIDQVLFSDGAVLQLFSEDYFTNSLQGEIHEMIFANFIEKLQTICISNEVEGSGNRFLKIEKKTHGNLLLSTEAKEEDDNTTTATVSTTESSKITSSTSPKDNSTLLKEIDNLIPNIMTDSKKEVLKLKNENNTSGGNIKEMTTSVIKELNEATQTSIKSEISDKSTEENNPSEKTPIPILSNTIKSTFSTNENIMTTKIINSTPFKISKDNEKISSLSTSNISDKINIKTSTHTPSSSDSLDASNLVLNAPNSNSTTLKSDDKIFLKTAVPYINKTVHPTNTTIPHKNITTPYISATTSSVSAIISQIDTTTPYASTVSHLNITTAHTNITMLYTSTTTNVNTTTAQTDTTTPYTNTTTAHTNTTMLYPITTTPLINTTIQYASTTSHVNTTTAQTNTTMLYPITTTPLINTTIQYTSTTSHVNTTTAQTDTTTPYTNTTTQYTSTTASHGSTTTANMNTTIPYTSTTAPLISTTISHVNMTESYTSTIISNKKRSTENTSTSASTTFPLNTKDSQNFPRNTSTSKSFQNMGSTEKSISQTLSSIKDYKEISKSSSYSPEYTNVTPSQLYSETSPIKSSESTSTMSSSVSRKYSDNQTSMPTISEFTTYFPSKRKENKTEMNITTTIQMKDLVNNTDTSTHKPSFNIKSNSVEILKENTTKSIFQTNNTEIPTTATTQQTANNTVSSIKIEKPSDLLFTSSQSSESVKRKSKEISHISKTETPSTLSYSEILNTSSILLKTPIQTNSTTNSGDINNQMFIKKVVISTTISSNFISEQIKQNHSMTSQLTTDNLTFSKSFNYSSSVMLKSQQNNSISSISPPEKFSNTFSVSVDSMLSNKTMNYIDMLNKTSPTTLKPSGDSTLVKENQTKSTTYKIEDSSATSTKLYQNNSKERESDQQVKPKIDTNENDECKTLSKLRLTKPEKGEKGEKGMKGDFGQKGDTGPPGKDGVCVESACKFSVPVKGEKGDSGKCTVNQCSAVKGDRGPIGLKGEQGLKGEKADINSLNIELIRHLALSIVKSEIESLNIFRSVKGEKGNPGICKCDPKSTSQGGPFYDIMEENVNVGYGSLIFETKEALEQVSNRLPAGSLVYVVKLDTFLVKVEQSNNIWRTISMDTKSKDWILPIPTFPKQEITQPPYVNGLTKRLHLIALPAPTMGDLKPMLRQPGGYSGAAFQCQQAGATYGFGRFLHPFINTDPFQLKFIIKSKYTNIPIHNSRGEILANDYSSLLSENELLQNEILDFKKESILGNILAPCIWVGKEATPNDVEYDKISESRCINWMSRDPFVNGLALMVSPQKPLFDESNKNLRPCSQQCYILCIQTEPYEL